MCNKASLCPLTLDMSCNSDDCHQEHDSPKCASPRSSDAKSKSPVLRRVIVAKAYTMRVAARMVIASTARLFCAVSPGKPLGYLRLRSGVGSELFANRARDMPRTGKVTDQVEFPLLDLEQQVFGRLRPFADLV